MTGAETGDGDPRTAAGARGGAPRGSATAVAANEPPAELPDGRAVEPGTVPVWRWSTLLGCVPPAAAGTVATLALSAADAPIAGFAWPALPALYVALGLLVWLYPPARYRHLRYRVDDIGITIQDGIVWRRQSAVPRVRIQHTDISQGPLQRRHGVATLKLYTAGSRFTLIELPGLAYDDAVALRDELIESGAGDAV